MERQATKYGVDGDEGAGVEASAQCAVSAMAEHDAVVPGHRQRRILRDGVRGGERGRGAGAGGGEFAGRAGVGGVLGAQWRKQDAVFGPGQGVRNDSGDGHRELADVFGQFGRCGNGRIG